MEDAVVVQEEQWVLRRSIVIDIIRQLKELLAAEGVALFVEDVQVAVLGGVV